MTHQRVFDVIIVGGSYSGLAAGMALGRALRNVLIIDSGKPCNRQTSHSHNFLTQDGKAPHEIAALARAQVQQYDTVKFVDGVATSGSKTERGFEIQVSSGESFSARKLIFATGINDLMPDIGGFSQCWGISILHCPYCHGYEVRNVPTGILGNGEYAFEFSTLISNWTNDITLFTNGPSTLSAEQHQKIEKNNITIVQKEIEAFEHIQGRLEAVKFRDGTTSVLNVLYARAPFEQHCAIPGALGVVLTEDGYIQIDAMQRTSIPGIFACGDNTSRMRTVANAVSMGTTAGMMVNKELTLEEFK